MYLTPSWDTHAHILLSNERNKDISCTSDYRTRKSDFKNESCFSCGTCLYGRRQLRVTVTQGDLRGYIIQSQGQSVIKKKKKNWLVLLLQWYRDGMDLITFHLWTRTESLHRCSSGRRVTSSSAAVSIQRQKLMTSTRVLLHVTPSGGREEGREANGC